MPFIKNLDIVKFDGMEILFIMKKNKAGISGTEISF